MSFSDTYQLDLFTSSASPPPGERELDSNAKVSAVDVINEVDEPAPSRCDLDKPRENALPSSLREALAWLEAEQGAATYFADKACALRTIGKVLERDLSRIPADPRQLMPLLESANPARIGVRPKRWGRIKSLVRRALKDVGYQIMPARDVLGLMPDWIELLATADRRRRYGLSGLASFSSRRLIAPCAVDQILFDQYREALLTSLRDRALYKYNRSVLIWNQAVRSEPSWPQRVIEPFVYARATPLLAACFLKSFQADVEAHLSSQANPDIWADDYRQPLRPATIKTRRRALYQLARALVETGVVAEEIVDLSVLTNPVNAELALRHLHNPDEMKGQKHLGNLAHILHATAKRSGRCSEADIEVLRKFAKRLHVPQKGMAERNAKRLRQFELPANRRLILSLPDDVKRRLEAEGRGLPADARAMMFAVAVSLLTNTTMRIGNLTALELNRHLRSRKHGRRSIWTINIPASEMKGSQRFESNLPDDCSELISLYIAKYRNRVTFGDGTMLFPGRSGAVRAPSRFGADISRFIGRETGLQMHPHLFRHFAGLLYLENIPDDPETVRQFLLHQSLSTTTNNYVELSNVGAIRKYQAILAQERRSLSGARPGKHSVYWVENGQ